MSALWCFRRVIKASGTLTRDQRGCFILHTICGKSRFSESKRRCFCNKRCQSAEHGSGVEPNCKGCSWLFCSAAFYPQPFSHCCWAGWAILLKRRSALEHGFGHFSVKWPLVRYLGKMMKEATHWSYFENSGIWIWAKIKSHWFWHSYQYTVMHWYVVVLWSFSLD